MIQVNISDLLSPRYRGIVGTMSSTRPLMARLGKRLEVDYKDHFESLQSRPNKRGWPKRNFWNDIRKSTQLTDVEDRSATVTVGDARLALHVYGGTVRAKRGANLAIPLTPEAYAAGSPREAASEMPNLFVLPSRSGRGAFLADAESFAYRGRVRLHYRLLPSVTVPRKPDALPDRSGVEESLSAEAKTYLDGVLTNKATNA